MVNMETEYAVIITDPQTGKKQLCRHDFAGNVITTITGAEAVANSMRKHFPDYTYETAAVRQSPIATEQARHRYQGR
jgi:hypothetical protein